MAQPSYYSEGVTPLPSDTKLKIWAKILGRYQNVGGADPKNDPAQADTIGLIMLKLVRAVGLHVHPNTPVPVLQKQVYDHIAKTGGGSATTNVWAWMGDPNHHVSATDDAVCLVKCEGRIQVWIKFSPGTSNAQWVSQFNLAGQCCQAPGDPCADASHIANLAGVVDRGSGDASYRITLTWNPHPHQELLTSLDVYIDGVFLESLAPGSVGVNYTDPGIGPAPNTSYTYKICSVFNNGCLDACAEVVVNAGCHGAAPSNFRLTDNASSPIIGLEWNCSIDPLVGFVISYGLNSGGPYPRSTLAAPVSRDASPDVFDAGTWFFVIQSDDGNGCLSVASNEISGTIP